MCTLAAGADGVEAEDLGAVVRGERLDLLDERLAGERRPGGGGGGGVGLREAVVHLRRPVEVERLERVEQEVAHGPRGGAPREDA